MWKVFVCLVLNKGPKWRCKMKHRIELTQESFPMSFWAVLAKGQPKVESNRFWRTPLIC